MAVNPHVLKVFSALCAKTPEVEIEITGGQGPFRTRNPYHELKQWARSWNWRDVIIVVDGHRFYIRFIVGAANVTDVCNERVLVAGMNKLLGPNCAYIGYVGKFKAWLDSEIQARVN